MIIKRTDVRERGGGGNGNSTEYGYFREIENINRRCQI